MVVDEELKNPMRSHHDLEKENARYVRKAIKVFVTKWYWDEMVIHTLSISFLEQLLLAFCQLVFVVIIQLAALWSIVKTHSREWPCCWYICLSAGSDRTAWDQEFSQCYWVCLHHNLSLHSMFMSVGGSLCRCLFRDTIPPLKRMMCKVESFPKKFILMQYTCIVDLYVL